MNENWFLMLNISVVGVTVLIIFLYAIFLTRKRFTAGFLHRARLEKKPNLLQRIVLKLFGDEPE
jgi:hypothetical protein